MFAIGLVLIITCCLIIYFFAGPISRLFVSDADVIAIAVRISRFMAPFYTAYLFGQVFSSTIRGCGETLLPMIITLISICVFRVVWVLIVTAGGRPELLLVAACYPLSWLLYGALFTVFYFFGKWKKRLIKA